MLSKITLSLPLAMAIAYAAVFNPYLGGQSSSAANMQYYHGSQSQPNYYYYDSYYNEQQPPQQQPNWQPQWQQQPNWQQSWQNGDDCTTVNQYQSRAVPVYLFTNGQQGRALMLHRSPSAYDPQVYSSYWNAGRLFCISPRPTADTAKPVYAYRLQKTNTQMNHFYTVNEQEIGVTREGQVGRYGYRCLGVLGYVSEQARAGMVPVHRWYSGRINQHLFDLDRGLGDRLNQGYRYEGIMGYVYPTC